MRLAILTSVSVLISVGCETNQAKIDELEDTVAQLQRDLAEAKTKLTQLEAADGATGNTLTALEARAEAVEELVSPFFEMVSVTGTDIVFEGANIHIRDGSGETYPTPPALPNGFGNLIIGYNEAPKNCVGGNNDDGRCVSDTQCPGGTCAAATQPAAAAVRTGSHNFIVGPEHTYESSGGFVAGQANAIGDPAVGDGGYGATITGGWLNKAPGWMSAISGGRGNTASGAASCVSGGDNNSAEGWMATVSGAADQTADGINEHLP